MEPQKTPASPKPPSPFALVFSLLFLAVLFVILGLAAALTVVALDFLAHRVDLATLTWAVVASVSGCGVGVVFWALAWLSRRAHQQELSQRRMVRALERLTGQPAGAEEEAPAGTAEVPAASPAKAAAIPAAGGLLSAEHVKTLVAELRELNVNVLLSEDQRKAKRQYLIQTQADRLAQQIEQAASAGDLVAAEEDLDRLIHLGPDSTRIGELKDAIDKARAEAEADDIRQVRSRAEDLMSAGEFAQAGVLAEEILSRYPSAPEAISLLARVQREAEAFAKDQRDRMYAEVEKQASGRHWRASLSAAERLLEAYPGSPEADAVRGQLETLRANARIEEVRVLRDEIRDMISRRRFAEAVERARNVVERFPDTAAAAELRQQMEKLEELAKGQQGGEA